MLVIHIISEEDTTQFSTIYRGYDKDPNTKILINPSSSKAKRAIIKEHNRIILIGHGTEYGLLNHRLDGYIVDSKIVNHLRNKEIIGIWCYAGNFADRYDLNGFFTSMFISNSNELIEHGFPIFNNCDSEIANQNEIFSERINNLLINNIPLSNWSSYLNNMITESDHRFVRYNYEAMISL